MVIYDQIKLLSKMSKLSGKPFMLISVDEDKIDLNSGQFDRHFDMLSDDLLDEVRHSGCAIVEMDDIMQAQQTYLAMEAAADSCADIGLYAMVFFDGHSMLGISQNKSVAIPAAQQVVSLLVM